MISNGMAQCSTYTKGGHVYIQINPPKGFQMCLYIAIFVFFPFELSAQFLSIALFIYGIYNLKTDISWLFRSNQCLCDWYSRGYPLIMTTNCPQQRHIISFVSNASRWIIHVIKSNFIWKYMGRFSFKFLLLSFLCA